MSRSVATAEVRTHQKQVLNGLDAVSGKDGKVRMGSDPIRTVQNEADEISNEPMECGDAAMLALIDEARIRAGMSWKEMRINANVPKGQWSEAFDLEGRGNVAWLWVMRQPRKFQLALRKITGRHFGLTEEAQAEADAERIGELVMLLLKRRVVSE